MGTSPAGLSRVEAARRLRDLGPNAATSPRRLTWIRLLWRQVSSPLLLILAFAAVVSAFAGEVADTWVVLLIVVASSGLGFLREHDANKVMEHLQSKLLVHCRVVRDGAVVTVPSPEIVPGDVLVLGAGDLVAADAVVIEATELFLSDAVLTGESFPTAKNNSPSLANAGLSGRSNCVFQGTSCSSGTGRALVVTTGRATAYGTLATRLELRPPETEFERGMRQFGHFLMSAMTVLVLAVLAVNLAFGRPAVEALLFSVALAVGLSPELLPAILTVNLSAGAQVLAKKGVLVRRLPAIENLGSLDILCTDKTGTLTEGVVSVAGCFSPDGQPAPEVLRLAQINARLQMGLANPIDEAIRQGADAPGSPPITALRKRGEIPYDFLRKRVSVIVDSETPNVGLRLITKGAVGPLLGVTTCMRDGRVMDDALRATLLAQVDAWASDGLRVLAVATRSVPEQAQYGRLDEHDLTLEGFLTLADRAKAGAAAAIIDLGSLGVNVKMITGDSRPVALHIAAAVGLDTATVLTGAQLDEFHDEALWHAAERTSIFAEVDPNQKERIILALRKTGHVVGFMGDGVNDVPALHAADASISVQDAVDIAREAADFVLLQPNLDVIAAGIREGRTTFANTMKYVLTTTSANLGNMVSMALASLVLPFLPLTAGQILLNNFLSDLPALGLARDSVDAELVTRPRRWDMKFLRSFMWEFGLLSSFFDLLTFWVLLRGFRASPELFRTGWFVESLLTELVVALVVRTRRRAWQSRPGRFLLGSTVIVGVIAIALPFTGLGTRFGFVAMPPALLGTIIAIAACYALGTEALKRVFYKRWP